MGALPTSQLGGISSSEGEKLMLNGSSSRDIDVITPSMSTYYEGNMMTGQYDYCLQREQFNDDDISIDNIQGPLGLFPTISTSGEVTNPIYEVQMTPDVKGRIEKAAFMETSENTNVTSRVEGTTLVEKTDRDMKGKVVEKIDTNSKPVTSTNNGDLEKKGGLMKSQNVATSRNQSEADGHIIYSDMNRTVKQQSDFSIPLPITKVPMSGTDGKQVGERSDSVMKEKKKSVNVCTGTTNNAELKHFSTLQKSGNLPFPSNDGQAHGHKTERHMKRIVQQGTDVSKPLPNKRTSTSVIKGITRKGYMTKEGGCQQSDGVNEYDQIDDEKSDSRMKGKGQEKVLSKNKPDTQSRTDKSNCQHSESVQKTKVPSSSTVVEPDGGTNDSHIKGKVQQQLIGNRIKYVQVKRKSVKKDTTTVISTPEMQKGNTEVDVPTMNISVEGEGEPVIESQNAKLNEYSQVDSTVNAKTSIQKTFSKIVKENEARDLEVRPVEARQVDTEALTESSNVTVREMEFNENIDGNFERLVHTTAIHAETPLKSKANKGVNEVTSVRQEFNQARQVKEKPRLEKSHSKEKRALNSDMESLNESGKAIAEEGTHVEADNLGDHKGGNKTLKQSGHHKVTTSRASNNYESSAVATSNELARTPQKRGRAKRAQRGLPPTRVQPDREVKRVRLASPDQCERGHEETVEPPPKKPRIGGKATATVGLDLINRAKCSGSVIYEE